MVALCLEIDPAEPALEGGGKNYPNNITAQAGIFGVGNVVGFTDVTSQESTERPVKHCHIALDVIIRRRVANSMTGSGCRSGSGHNLVRDVSRGQLATE